MKIIFICCSEISSCNVQMVNIFCMSMHNLIHVRHLPLYSHSRSLIVLTFRMMRVKGGMYQLNKPLLPGHDIELINVRKACSLDLCSVMLQPPQPPLHLLPNQESYIQHFLKVHHLQIYECNCIAKHRCPCLHNLMASLLKFCQCLALNSNMWIFQALALKRFIASLIYKIVFVASYSCTGICLHYTSQLQHLTGCSLLLDLHCIYLASYIHSLETQSLGWLYPHPNGSCIPS